MTNIVIVPTPEILEIADLIEHAIGHFIEPVKTVPPQKPWFPTTSPRWR